MLCCCTAAVRQGSLQECHNRLELKNYAYFVSYGLQLQCFCLTWESGKLDLAFSGAPNCICRLLHIASYIILAANCLIGGWKVSRRVGR